MKTIKQMNRYIVIGAPHTKMFYFFLFLNEININKLRFYIADYTTIVLIRTIYLCLINKINA